jgi:hypothetical protein
MTARGDPLQGVAFDAIYDREIEPQLVRLEVERVKAMRTARIIWGATAVAIAGWLIWSAVRGGLFNAIGLAFFIGAVGAGLGFLALQSVGTKAKIAMIGALCRPLGITYTPLGFQPPEFERFKDLLPTHSDRSFQDLFMGSYRDTDLCLYEATLSTGSGKERRTVFSGQLLKVGFPQRFLGVTVVLRDGAGFNRPKGLEKVGLEDPRFEKTFDVFGSDQVEARAILTPTFMQRLTQLEEAYDGENLRCAFTEGCLLLAIEGPNRFEIGDIFSNLAQRDRVRAIAYDIQQVFALIDAFRAGARA